MDGNKKSLYSNLFYKIVFLLFSLILLLIYSSFFSGFETVTIVWFFINEIVWSIAFLIDENHYFSLYRVSLLFIYVFLILAPAAQIANQYSPWGYSFSIEIQNLSFLVVFIWLVFLIMGKIFFKLKRVSSSAKSNNYVSSSSFDRYFIPMLFALDVLLLGVFAGYQNLFVRDMFSFKTGSMFDIAIDLFLKSLPILLLCIFKQKSGFVKKHNLLFFLLLAYTLLINNPVSNSRFLALSVICGLLFMLIPGLFLSNYIDLFILVGILIVFPITSQFKDNSSLTFSAFSIRDVFCSVDFDAFCFIENGILYVSRLGILHGKQIVSSIFFFVPRAFIPIKGVNSGELIVKTLYPGNYSNVSCPFLIEGLLDFGVFGVLLYALLFSYVTNCLDYKFKKKLYSGQSDIFFYVYPFLYGYWIYIMRGSLAPTILRLFGFLLPFLLYSSYKSIIVKLFPKKHIYTLKTIRKKLK